MSGIIDLQRRMRELGRLRMGHQLVGRNGKPYPAKLAEWRLTSPSEDLLVTAAEHYGGEVRVWDSAPTEGRQYELLTGSAVLDVLVPPEAPLSQAWELWSGGGCVRRCNGRAQHTGEPCACPSDLATRLDLSKKGQACKPTTRFSVVLPRVPDVGVWRVESHGINAAVELPGTVEVLQAAAEQGVFIPAQLRIEGRTSKSGGETRHYVVPVLTLPTMTMGQLSSPEGRAAISQGAPAEIGPAEQTAIGPAVPTPEPKKAAPRKRPAAKAPVHVPEPVPVPGDEPDEAPERLIGSMPSVRSQTPPSEPKSPGQQLHIQANDVVKAIDGDFKADLLVDAVVLAVTNLRTDSTKELDQREANVVARKLNDIRRGTVEIVEHYMVDGSLRYGLIFTDATLSYQGDEPKVEVAA